MSNKQITQQHHTTFESIKHSDAKGHEACRNSNPAEEMQQFTSDPHTRDFMNPNWVGLAGGASQQASQRQGDDPKARGRSARGG